MDVLSAIPDANIKEEPAEEEATTIILEGSPVWDYPTNTITEEPTEEEATTNHVTIPTDVPNGVLREEPADQAAAEVAIDHKCKAPPPKTKKAKNTSARQSTPPSTPSSRNGSPSLAATRGSGTPGSLRARDDGVQPPARQPRCLYYN